MTPATHLSAEEIGRKFAEATFPHSEPGESRRLRTTSVEFVSADMGMSGANFAIADAGLLPGGNEGNIELSTTCPKLTSPRWD